LYVNFLQKGSGPAGFETRHHPPSVSQRRIPRIRACKISQNPTRSVITAYQVIGALRADPETADRMRGAIASRGVVPFSAGLRRGYAVEFSREAAEAMADRGPSTRPPPPTAYLTPIV
jgi:hypothetical protein